MHHHREGSREMTVHDNLITKEIVIVKINGEKVFKLHVKTSCTA